MNNIFDTSEFNKTYNEFQETKRNFEKNHIERMSELNAAIDRMNKTTEEFDKKHKDNDDIFAEIDKMLEDLSK